MQARTSRRNSRRGTTLVELMVGMAVSSIVLLAVMAIATAQSRLYNDGRRVRERQGQSRFGVDFLERTIRQAGFGVDPQFAFDFDFYKCTQPDGTTALGYASPNCTAATRDAVDGPDELVTYTRNPNYLVKKDDVTNTLVLNGLVWTITDAPAVAATSYDTIKLDMRVGDYLRKGQVLLLACTGAQAYTYVTVGANVDPLTSANSAVAVTLAPMGTNAPWFRQNSVLASAGASGCFKNNGLAYRIDRSHFFIRSDQAAVPRPYLVLDTGTDFNGDGNITDADLIPLAADIVDLQFAYSLANQYTSNPNTTLRTDNDANGVWGDGAPATGEELTALVGSSPLSGQLPGTPRPCTNVSDKLNTGQVFGAFHEPCLYDKANDDRYRQMEYPGNIRSVRISVVARTESPQVNSRAPVAFLPPGNTQRLGDRLSPDLSGTSLGGYADFYASGSAGAALRTGYRYMETQLSVYVPNLQNNGQFMF